MANKQAKSGGGMNDYEISFESALAEARKDWRFRFWEVVHWPRHQVERVHIRLMFWLRRRREADALQADFDTWDQLSDEALLAFDRWIEDDSDQTFWRMAKKDAWVNSGSVGETNESHAGSALPCPPLRKQLVRFRIKDMGDVPLTISRWDDTLWSYTTMPTNILPGTASERIQ